jgi:hypothetical protein
MPPFLLRPWDAPRPRLNPPRADFPIEHQNQTFHARAQNGLLFFVDAMRGEEWVFVAGSPLPLSFVDEREWLQEQLEAENIARYVLFPYRGEGFTREFPMFLKPDGSGWCRESWNLDDISFTHELSIHEWLEAPQRALFDAAREAFEREVAPALETMSWPPDRNRPLEFVGGTRAELGEIVRCIVALEPSIQTNAAQIVRVTCGAESPFARAGVYAVRAESGSIQVAFNERGERLISSWRAPTLQLSQRFWTLCDWAIDCITPRGVYWDYHDRGRGRLSESPVARDFSMQFIAEKLPNVNDARGFLQDWLRNVGADSGVLEENDVAEFEVSED